MATGMNWPRLHGNLFNQGANIEQGMRAEPFVLLQRWRRPPPIVPWQDAR